MLSSHQIHNATRLGIDGTAMPSYEGSRSDEQLWDIAFYVQTLRQDVRPAAQKPEAAITLADLARLPDEVLLRNRPDLDARALHYYRRNPPAP